MAADRQAVEAAVDQWFVALNAMLNGDPQPFAELYSHAEDVTYMGAEGTYRIGWEPTWADWQAQAAKSSGGKVAPADLHIVVVGDMATATQHHHRRRQESRTARWRKHRCARPAFFARRTTVGG